MSILSVIRTAWLFVVCTHASYKAMLLFTVQMTLL